MVRVCQASDLIRPLESGGWKSPGLRRGGRPAVEELHAGQQAGQNPHARFAIPRCAPSLPSRVLQPIDPSSAILCNAGSVLFFAPLLMIGYRDFTILRELLYPLTPVYSSQFVRIAPIDTTLPIILKF